MVGVVVSDYGNDSGCTGYVALEEFARRHHQALVERLSIPSSRLPSDSTFRRMMINIDFEELASVFNQWAKDYVLPEETEWLAIDGKSIKGTVSNYDNAYQNFVQVVTSAMRLFAHDLDAIFLLFDANNK